MDLNQAIFLCAAIFILYLTILAVAIGNYLDRIIHELEVIERKLEKIKELLRR